MSIAVQKLRNNYISVANIAKASYGGSQMRSEKPVIKRCGCGLIAACDLLLYLHRHHKDCNSDLFEGLTVDEAVPISAYNALLDKLSPLFPIIPPFGISGPLLVLGLNIFFRQNHYPYKALWAMNETALWRRTKYMLEQDFPVIISVGQNLPFIWQKHKLNLYVERGGQKIKASSVKAHFMTATAIDDEWLCVSSWGRKYYINIKEYDSYVREHSSTLINNIVYIYRK